MLALTLMLVVAGALWSQRTTRRSLRVETTRAQVSQTGNCDTLIGTATDVLRLSGYDKPLRSRKETMFATNNGTDTVLSIAVSIIYMDIKGRELHRRSGHVRQTIPPGQTRSVDVPSWDIQQSFYYRRSAVPSRAPQATPYDVAINVDTLFVTAKRLDK